MLSLQKNVLQIKCPKKISKFSAGLEILNNRRPGMKLENSET